MKVVVFTSKEKFHSEVPSVIKMFEAGLRTLHVRKPKFSTKELEEYILAIPAEYRSNMVIHSHHELASLHKLKGIHFGRTHRKDGFSGMWQRLKKRVVKGRKVYTKSAHSLSSLSENAGFYSYTFLSPVFDSISKADYKSKFGSKSIKNTLAKTNQPVYALGGIDIESVEKAFEYGFDGVALLGAIWESEKSPFEAYKELSEKIKSLEKKAA